MDIQSICLWNFCHVNILVASELSSLKSNPLRPLSISVCLEKSLVHASVVWYWGMVINRTKSNYQLLIFQQNEDHLSQSIYLLVKVLKLILNFLGNNIQNRYSWSKRRAVIKRLKVSRDKKHLKMLMLV